MLAKLRAGSGSAARSRSVTTLWWTALARSIDCAVIDDGCDWTVADSETLAGLRVTVKSSVELTATLTTDDAAANPGRATVTRHSPGASDSRRNSPMELEVVWRTCEVVVDATSMLALAMRAAVASRTMPRRLPVGVWAPSAVVESKRKSARQVRMVTSFFRDTTVRLCLTE